MPIQLRDLTRSRTVAARRAADFGADQPYVNSGDYYTQEQCDALAELLSEGGYRDDLQINVEPLARSVPALTRDVERLMVKFAYWRCKQGPGGAVENAAPDSVDTREPGWFDFFFAAAPVQEGHGNHAHILVREFLTVRDERKLAKFGRRLGLKVSVSRNTVEWLAKAEERYGVSSHQSRIRYVVKHLRRRGSDYRFSRSQGS